MECNAIDCRFHNKHAAAIHKSKSSTPYRTSSPKEQHRAKVPQMSLSANHKKAIAVSVNALFIASLLVLYGLFFPAMSVSLAITTILAGMALAIGLVIVS